MKVSYTGKQTDLAPREQRKLEQKLAKLGKMLDRRGEKEAHVVITAERHLNKVEINVPFYDRPLVGLHSDPDLFQALAGAIEKIEKQLLKLREKWRDTRRVPESKEVLKGGPEPAAAPAKATRPAKAAKPAKPPRAARPADDEDERRIYRVNHHARRKPMTLDEAVLEMDERDYMVYRDAETGGVSVLVKRKDGHYDLIES